MKKLKILFVIFIITTALVVLFACNKDKTKTPAESQQTNVPKVEQVPGNTIDEPDNGEETNVLLDNELQFTIQARTYNGQQQGLVQGRDFTSKDGEATIKYKDKNSVYSFTDVAPTNAGEYIAQVSIPAHGKYNAIVREQEFIIAKRLLKNISISRSYNGSLSYEEQLNINHGIVSSSEQVIVKFTTSADYTDLNGKGFANVGVKEIIESKIVGAHSSNYEIDLETAELEITKNRINCEIIMGENFNNKIYIGIDKLSDRIADINLQFEKEMIGDSSFNKSLIILRGSNKVDITYAETYPGIYSIKYEVESKNYTFNISNPVLMSVINVENITLEQEVTVDPLSTAYFYLPVSNEQKLLLEKWHELDESIIIECFGKVVSGEYTRKLPVVDKKIVIRNENASVLLKVTTGDVGISSKRLLENVLADTTLYDFHLDYSLIDNEENPMYKFLHVSSNEAAGQWFYFEISEFLQWSTRVKYTFGQSDGDDSDIYDLINAKDLCFEQGDSAYFFIKLVNPGKITDFKLVVYEKEI